MGKTQFDFGKCVQQGLDVYINNIFLLLTVSLVATVLSSLTVGILAGPMAAGTIMIVLALLDGRDPKPELAELFNGFHHFLDAFLFVLVWGAILVCAQLILAPIVVFGQFAWILLPLVANAFLMFGLFLITEKTMPFWDASMLSINTVKADFFPLLGISLIAALLGSAGALICGLGIIITLPIYWCILAVVYRETFRVEDAKEEAEEVVNRES